MENITEKEPKTYKPLTLVDKKANEIASIIFETNDPHGWDAIITKIRIMARDKIRKMAEHLDDEVTFKKDQAAQYRGFAENIANEPLYNHKGVEYTLSDT